MSSAKSTEAELLRRLAADDIQNPFFQDLETEPFPEAEIKALFPELVEEWEIMGKLQSVPWPWVMAMELSLAGFLSPTACLWPIGSIPIHALTWVFLLHPGSTQTSGAIRVYQDIMDILEIRINKDRARLSAEWKQIHPNPGHGEKNPFVGDVSITMGSGSLEGDGKEKSADRNYGRSCAFLTEGKRFFTWLLNESALNESIVMELYERARWKRTTLDATRSFSMYYPFFAVFAAVHLGDLAAVFGSDDTQGIRGRARFFYTRPCFKRAREIRDANEAHNAGWKYVDTVADAFMRIHKAHSLDYSNKAAFHYMKDYPFRMYSLCEGQATALFDANFDLHAGKQEENYLQHHQLAKLHGKKKTSNMRFAFQIFLREEARLQHAPDVWQTQIDSRCVRFAMHYGDYLDGISDKVATLFSSLQGHVLPSSVSGSTNIRDKFQRLANSDLDTLETLSPEKQGLLAATVRAVLLKPTPWVVSAWLRAAPEVRSKLEAASIVPNDIDEYMARAGALFISSRLGAFSVSTNAHGPKTLFFVKRPLENTNPSYVLYLNMIRTGFGLPLDQVKAFAPEHVQTQKPRNATDPIFPDEITEEVAGAIQPRIAAFGAHAAPLG